MIITGAVYISQLLKVTHTLQELNVSGNDISDDGMAVISAQQITHYTVGSRVWVFSGR